MTPTAATIKDLPGGLVEGDAAAPSSASGDSSQHSLVTWFTWVGANLTMAVWV